MGSVQAILSQVALLTTLSVLGGLRRATQWTGA